MDREKSRRSLVTLLRGGCNCIWKGVSILCVSVLFNPPPFYYNGLCHFFVFETQEQLKKISTYIIFRTIVRSSNVRYKYVSFVHMYLWINGLAWCVW